MSITTFESTGTIVPTTFTALAVIERWGEVLPRSFVRLLAAEACPCFAGGGGAELERTESGLFRPQLGGGSISEGGPKDKVATKHGERG